MTAENNDTAMKVYLHEIGQAPLLRPQQEIDLAAKIKNGDQSARALMISSNLRLVVTNRTGLREPRFAGSRRYFRGKHRTNDGGRSVRSSERSKAQHICSVVDQAIHQARPF